MDSEPGVSTILYPDGFDLENIAPKVQSARTLMQQWAFQRAVCTSLEPGLWVVSEAYGPHKGQRSEPVHFNTMYKKSLFQLEATVSRNKIASATMFIL